MDINLEDIPIVFDSDLNISPSLKNLEQKSIEDYILSPKIPQRKGKKSTVRLPFVLTSTAWKNMVSEKNKIKNAKEEGIKERKEERERKRNSKENKPNKPKSKSSNKEKINKPSYIF